MTRCPLCNKRVEPLLAPHHVVVEGQVYPVCSAGCLTRARRRLAHGAERGGVLRPWYFPSFLLSLLSLEVLLKVVMVGSGAALLIFGGQLLATRDQGGVPFALFAQPQKGRLVQFTQDANFASAKKVERQDDTMIYHERSQALLRGLLKRSSETLWDLAGLEVLAEQGSDEAQAKLRGLLGLDRGPKRRAVAHMLAKLGDKKALFLLREDLNSTNPTVASMAAFSLGQLGDQSAYNSLRQLMRFKQTRYAAAEAALQLKYAPARQYLYKLATTAKRRGDRVRAAYSLAKAGDTRVVPMLLQALNDGTQPYMAALGLASLGKREAIPMLNKAVMHVSLRLEAARSLARLKSFEAVPELARQLSSANNYEKITAACAVFVLTSKKLELEKSAMADTVMSQRVALRDWMNQWLRL